MSGERTIPTQGDKSVCIHRLYLSNWCDDLDHTLRLLRDALRSVRGEAHVDLEATIAGADALAQRVESQIEECLEDQVGEFAQLGRP